MVRRTLHKIIPAYAIFPLILSGSMQLFSYAGAKLIQFFADTGTPLDMTTAFDLSISATPVWVWIYVLSYLFWVFQYITVVRENPTLCYQLVTADFIIKILCFAFFILLPTTNTRPELEGNGSSVWLLNLIYLVDTPTNLFPSMHCFVAWLGTRYIFRCKRLRHRLPVSIACLVGSLLVFASTLFTKQHVVYDVIAAIAVTEIGCLVAHFTPLPRALEALNARFVKTRLSKILY